MIVHTASTQRPVAVDLFCGGGGASLGLLEAGFQTFGADTSEHALATHDHNLTGETVQHDLGDVDPSLFPSPDLLHASPPCKGFSPAGQMESDDERNELVWTTLDWVAALDPAAVTIENVPQMLDSQSSQRLRRRFEEFGYSVTWSVLDAADYGVPQRRRRLFVVASRDGSPSIPDPTHAKGGQRTLTGDDLNSWRTVGDVFDGATSDGGLVPPNSTTPTHSDEVTTRLGRLDHGESVSDLRNPGTSKQGQVRLDPDDVSPTLTGGESDLVHPFEDRTLSVREMARLQSFPDWFEFKGPRTSGGKRRQEVNCQTEQVGNAVPPRLMEAVATHVRSEVLGS